MRAPRFAPVLVVLLASLCSGGTVLAALAVRPSAAQEPQALSVTDVLTDVRVHGNHTMPDAEIIQLSGLTIGQPLDEAALQAARKRLLESGRFESVELRKRFRTLSGRGNAVVILLVHERPAYEEVPSPLRPIRRALGNGMFLPILSYTDGYGFTYGARVSFMDTLGRGGRISVPLTWGGTKRAAVELDRPLERGPFDRVFGGAAIGRRKNPHYDLDDDRRELWVGASRQIVRGLRVEGHARLHGVDFGETDDRVAAGGVGLVLDTRHDPGFPRNAVYLGAGWEALSPRGRNRINVYRAEARGYAGVFGQSVFSVGTEYRRADAPLPPYERFLLGGAGTLRGHRAGSFAGDNLVAASAELRVPISSPLHMAKTGMTLFVDAGTAYDHGTTLRDARFHYGAGGGVFLFVSVFRVNLDLAFREGGKARLHLMSGFQF